MIGEEGRGRGWVWLEFFCSPSVGKKLGERRYDRENQEGGGAMKNS